MRNGRWSELCAEPEVRYTANDWFLVITISKISGVQQGFYGLVVGEYGPQIRQKFTSPNHVGVSPVSC